MSYKKHILMSSTVLLLLAYAIYMNGKNKESQDAVAKIQLQLNEIKATAKQQSEPIVLTHKKVVTIGSPKEDKKSSDSDKNIVDRPEFDSEYEKQKTIELSHFLEDTVKSQEKNSEWSAKAETELKALDGKFVNSTIKSIDCRSTMCYLEVEHKDSTALHVWDIQSPFSNPETMFDKRLTINLDDNKTNIVTKMFMAQQGTQFPELPN